MRRRDHQMKPARNASSTAMITKLRSIAPSAFDRAVASITSPGFTSTPLSRRFAHSGVPRDRTSVVEDKSVAVRVYLGGRRTLHKQQKSPLHTHKPSPQI